MNLLEHFETLGVSNPDMWAASQEAEGTDHLTALTILRAFVDIADEAPAIFTAMREDPQVPATVRRSVAAISAAADHEDLNRAAKALSHEVILRVCALLDGAMVPQINPNHVLFGLQRLEDTGTDFEPVGQISGLQERLPDVAATVLGEDVVTL